MAYDKNCPACAGKGNHHTHAHNKENKQQHGDHAQKHEKHGQAKQGQAKQESNVGRYWNEQDSKNNKKGDKE